MTNLEIAKALRALADAVEARDDRRFEAAVAKFSVVGSSRAKGETAKVRRPISKIDRKRVSEMVAELSSLESREQGLQVLEKRGLSKSELIAVAAEGNVHTTKIDDISRIQEKIVETLIGSRLNSFAIRGARL